MTWIHDPYKHKLDGRSYNQRIGKPYYGDKLRRIISPEATEPSFIERVTEWYDEMTMREIMVVMFAVFIAVMFAALIVY